MRGLPPGELASESATITDDFGAGETDTPHFAVAAETIAALAVLSVVNIRRMTPLGFICPIEYLTNFRSLNLELAQTLERFR